MRGALAALVLGALGCACAGRGVNYCGAKMCAHSNAHTFCQYPPGPSPQCRGYMDATLTAEEKVRLVARLNRRRSEAASGRLRRLPSAGNMLKLRWVEELAREAQRWADQCRPPGVPDERDACRDLFSTSVGQCVASVVGEAPGLRVESMVDVWYMQSKDYKGNITHYVAPMSNVGFYGDFAQMVWARSYMVGCGRSRFMADWNGRLRSVERLVCNIAPQGPQPSRPLWAPAPPTSICLPRSVPDPELPALCNYPETVRELQEALDRMEKSLGESSPSSVKVRRELRKLNVKVIPLEQSTEENLQEINEASVENQHGLPESYQHDAVHDNNKTDKSPMLNMVLKYLPYLKPYQKEILTGVSASSLGCNLVTSYVLISFGFVITFM